MKIAITGSSGLIGSHLIQWFDTHGYSLTRLIRTKKPFDSGHPSLFWDPEKKEIEWEKLSGHDVVIHLAGDSVASGRWTTKKKESILHSRVNSTSFLSKTLASLEKRPQLLISASAVGIYGNHPAEERLTEETPFENGQKGFLASVTKPWEEATLTAQQAGIRVINLRFGMVLSIRGGALKQMLPIFKLGLGGPIGNGKQMISWISIQDIPRIIHHLIEKRDIEGPVNVTAPNPINQHSFATMLGKALRRPSVLPLPSFAVKLLMGEMGEELLLWGASVVPRKLQDSGYHFIHPDLKTAFYDLFQQPH